MAIERVKIRVQEGGHDIDTETIRRRYTNGIKNLPIVDEAMIFDNSDGVYEIVAEKNHSHSMIVVNEVKFQVLKQYADL